MIGKSTLDEEKEEGPHPADIVTGVVGGEV